jgi:hypothetical protein
MENNPSIIHVDKDSKNASISSTPPRDIFTSTSQKKKYITIAGIESDTSYLEYQWPTFAIKELNDNADDFFKVYYPNATNNERKVSTKVTIDTVVKRPVNIIRIAVRNSNVNNYQVFSNPSGIFDYNSWGSTKRYQHKMTASALGDFLKRILGMGYASWTNINSYSTQDSFEDKQWDEPVILRFNRKEYKAFIEVVNGDIKPTRIEESATITKDIGTDTEVEVALPLSAHWNTNYNALLNHLERYHRIWKLVKRNTEFGFSKEVI